VDQQPLEHRLDVARAAELANDARAPAPLALDDHQIARPDVAAPLPVDGNGNVRNEERLADELLAAPVDLDDLEVVQPVRL